MRVAKIIIIYINKVSKSDQNNYRTIKKKKLEKPINILNMRFFFDVIEDRMSTF